MSKSPTPYVSKAHLQAIGNLAAYWAYLEWIVEYAIWAAADIEDDEGRAITTHIGMISRSQILIMLLHQKFSDTQCSPMEKLLARIEPLRIERNDFIHAIWFHDKTNPVAKFAKFTAKGKLKVTTREVSAADIRSVTAKINDATYEMMIVLDDLFPARRFPWQGKPPSPNPQS